jgi:hypothetical protein
MQITLWAGNYRQRRSWYFRALALTNEVRRVHLDSSAPRDIQRMWKKGGEYRSELTSLSV